MPGGKWSRKKQKEAIFLIKMGSAIWTSPQGSESAILVTVQQQYKNQSMNSTNKFWHVSNLFMQDQQEAAAKTL